jgi:hypothetical protein
MWDLWWTEWRWVLGFPANLHSTNCSTITLIYHLGLVGRPVVADVPSGLSLTPLKIIIQGGPVLRGACGSVVG